ncbi:MAG: aminoacyl-tRNA hydrolase [Patescibacteria group bacterium]|jgi:PTH1 family peptidyl-tRNA hydrolase|nr:aminoacyl-tRNA hydrolase [Patescibacteria group bacterium]
MKVIVGLGNPGKEYELTRHNFGFTLLNRLSLKLGINFNYEKKFEAEVAVLETDGQKIFLVKPQTFMNRSGEAVKKIIEYFKIDVKDVVVIYDDIDLDLGTFKTTGSSSAGHRGMESILKSLNTSELARYRLGINSHKKESIPTDVFVLDRFAESEAHEKEKVIDDVAKQILIDLKIKQ